ncbi:carbohydrate ABC transporter permease [Paenibacillus sp. TRM 82003]|uniref:carbohydrate ABC transporter permease n=1 Tax=Kineococcus sp. TRM81007 TaxID=2925831 RepID=UPI001F562776|nr:carbohydrate ABC transporter permease [Kineococcus sp. TRM81007]MCI2239349.1 carbohydrate ABC transporter permease [Kineococcus sp. TRM81007]MCI3925033.1 carbohydrate ABC transporter permease [Paenibacillus sp. TRM 82003]
MSGQTDTSRVVTNPTGEIESRPRKLSRAEKRAIAAKNRLSSPAASVIALLIAALWTVPTLGLLITSFRVESDIQTDGWWNAFARPLFTGYNYVSALETGLGDNFVNTLVITIPAVVIPITLALLAAYAFAWIPFRGRELLFVAVFALQVVPLQVTLIPLLSLYVDLGIDGSFWTVWLSHTMFGLPLAIFLLHNFMKDVPASLVEAARMDGAGHVTVFFKVLLPLLVPAIAAFGVFQFLWVWNDLLIALTFAGGDATPLTSAIADLAGTRNNAWYLLAPGAFLAMAVPLAVFLGLQRFFVRGLLAGSVKG